MFKTLAAGVTASFMLTQGLAQEVERESPQNSFTIEQQMQIGSLINASFALRSLVLSATDRLTDDPYVNRYREENQAETCVPLKTSMARLSASHALML